VTTTTYTDTGTLRTLDGVWSGLEELSTPTSSTRGLARGEKASARAGEELCDIGGSWTQRTLLEQTNRSGDQAEANDLDHRSESTSALKGHPTSVDCLRSAVSVTPGCDSQIRGPFLVPNERHLLVAPSANGQDPGNLRAHCT
jgi:hypothetical protein